jgi:prepilin signal peptidase PulO-like enzyme (type II secretory pathway)
MGDAKLFVALTPIAAHFGVLLMWQSWCWILGGIAAIVLHIKSRGKIDALPFAPFLFAGLFLAIWTI